ncbi:MAG: protein kinase, partial [Kofleriaceae bacterium]
ENSLLEFVTGKLSPADAEAIELHLDGCPDCQLIHAELSRSAGPLATGTAPDPIPLGLADPATLTRGTVVGRYMIHSVLGHGGMGVVYKAYDPELDRSIALKVVRFDVADSQLESARERLLREAKTLAQLSHPNVVAVHDVGTYEHDLFIAMELVEGTTLRAWLASDKRAPHEVLAVFVAAGSGLAAAHKLGIVHRDFKPENVMVGEDGRIRVVDFGLARTVAAPSGRSSVPVIGAGPAGRSLDAALTQGGVVIGTPAYMAPEQDLGQPVDARSDQFSFCAALYEALYQQLPFAGTDYAEIANHRLAGELQPPPTSPSISAKIRRAVLKGLSRQPADRHSSMQALLAELRGGGWNRRSRVAIASLAVAAIGGTGWAAWMVAHRPPSIDDTCSETMREVDRVWSAHRRNAFAAKLTALGVPDARGVADRIVAWGDDWSNEWKQRRVDVCRAAMRTSTGTGPAVAEQLQCLQRQLTNLDASLTVLIDTDAVELASMAEQRLRDLPRPSSCDKTIGVPSDPRRAEWQPIIKHIIDARLARQAGRIDDAIASATIAVEQARATTPDDPLCPASLELGAAQAKRADHATARTTLLEAIRMCTKIDENGLVIEAWMAILEMAFYTGRFDDSFDRDLQAAELAAERLDQNAPGRAIVLYLAGAAQLIRGNVELAEHKLRDSLDRWTRAGAEANKLNIASVQVSMGLVLAYSGMWDEARKTLEASVETWKAHRAVNPNSALGLSALAQAEVLQLRFDQAIPLFEQAVAMAEATGAEGKLAWQLHALQLADVHARNSRCDEAAALLDRVRPTLAKLKTDPASLAGLALLVEGRCQLARRRAAEAVATLERAVQAAHDTPVNAIHLPRAEIALAYALDRTGTSRTRAVEIAKRARERFARFPGARAELTEIDAWLQRLRRR